MENEITSLKAQLVTMERRQASVVKAAVKVPFGLLLLLARAGGGGKNSSKASTDARTDGAYSKPQ